MLVPEKFVRQYTQEPVDQEAERSEGDEDGARRWLTTGLLLPDVGTWERVWVGPVGIKRVRLHERDSAKGRVRTG